MLVFLVASCSEIPIFSDPYKAPKPVNIDLPELLKRGKLTILAENSSTSFFVYRGKSMGFEYEILKEFAAENGLDVEVKIIEDLDMIPRMLNSGEGDLVACNFTSTRERNRKIDFSIPIIRTPQVLIQRKPANWQNLSTDEYKKHVIRDPADLMHKKVHVWKNSSYYKRLEHMQDEFGDTIYVQAEPGTVSVEEMIEMVSDGVIDYTIADEYIAHVNAHFYPNLDYFMYLSIRQNIAFGLRKSSQLLKAKLNRWLAHFMSSKTFHHLRKKYFEPSPTITENTNYLNDIKGGNLSVFDSLFKQAVIPYNWDWRLLASIAFQESKFNPEARGFGGAYGMMQFMPGTGPSYGVYPHSPPAVQIKGAIKKLNKDYQVFTKVKDHEQRCKFAIAAYNAGLGHVLDAQRLCAKYKMNPYVWDKQVEYMLLNLNKSKFYRDRSVRCGSMHGMRTFRYVKDVFERYNQWKLIYK